LSQTARGNHKLADSRRTDRGRPGGVEENVNLLLVECLFEDGEIQRRIVNAPSQGHLGAIVSEWKEISGYTRLGHRALREAVPVHSKPALQYEALPRRPVVLCIYAGLRVGGLRAAWSREGGLPHQRAIRAQCLDFSACSILAKLQACDVRTQAGLVSSMPVPRCRNQVEQSLHAAAMIVHAFEEISSRSIHQ